MEYQWLSTPPPRRRSRRSAPKTKTGCVTCKKRKIKCDETKPECIRCQKSGFKCDGYVQRRHISTMGPSNMTLAPKVSQLCRSPSSGSSVSSQALSYFQRFCVYTAPYIVSNPAECELWNRIILQASESDQCIRHAVAAIGALDLKDFGSEQAFLMKSRREFALTEYHRAIISLKSSIAERRLSMRTRLITCILFACFESYHGNGAGAVAQMTVGIDMIEDYLGQSNRQLPSTASIPDVENELIGSFKTFEIQMCSIHDQRDSEVHLERMFQCAGVVEATIRFKSIQDSFVPIVINLMRAIHLSLSQINQANQKTGFVFGTPALFASGTCRSDWAYSKLCTILASFQQWNNTFEPLYQRARASTNKELLKSACLVRLHYIASVLWTAAQSPFKSTYYRRYTNEFHELLELVNFWTSVHVQSHVSFDMQFVLALAIAGCYRHRKIRKQILEFFSQKIRKEIIWDTVMLGKIIGWISQIEEEGLDDEEYVPEKMAANIVSLKIDQKRRLIEISCRKGAEMCFKEANMSW